MRVERGKERRRRVGRRRKSRGVIVPRLPAVGFTLFFLGEYGNMIRMCGRTAVRFRGGWRGRPGRGGGARWMGRTCGKSSIKSNG